MAILENALSTLLGVGNDAQSNLYRVRISGGKFTDEDINQALTIRCDGFNPPTPSQDAYEVKYITASLKRPVSKVTLDRHFTLKFRADNNWEVLKKLNEQKKVTMNDSKSFVEHDIASIEKYLFNVKIDIIDKLSESETSEDNVRTIFEFRKCWIESVTPSEWSTEGNQPMTIECSINFLEMSDWNSGDINN